MKKQYAILVMTILVSLAAFAEAPRGFHDYFGPHSLETWSQSGTNWHIRGSFLSALSGQNNSFFIYDNYTGSDMIVETVFDVYMPRHETRGGIMFRSTSPSAGQAVSGYFAGINPNRSSLILAKIEEGRETVLAEADIPESDYSCTLRVQAHGERITVFYNDNLKIETRDNTFSSGMVGLRVISAALESVWMVTADSIAPNQNKIPGGDWNQLAFNSLIKDSISQHAQQGTTFGPTRWLGTNFSVLKNFVDQKTAGIDAPMERAKALYDWVINNVYYDHEAIDQQRGVKSVLPMDVFREPITNCNGYAALYATFLNLAGIPAIFSGGPTDTRQNYNYSGDHTWVEAYIDGQWRIMDPTFDSRNSYRNGRRTQHINRDQWHYFDPPVSRFARSNRIDRYYVQPTGAVTPQGDLEVSECVIVSRQGHPKEQTASLLERLADTGDYFFWQDYENQRELSVVPGGNKQGNIVFRNVNAGEDRLWRIVAAGKNQAGNHLVRIQSAVNGRFVQLVGEDRIGTYLELNPEGADGDPGTVFELVILDDGSMNIFTPQRGFLMRGGNQADARLQRVAYWNTLMGRFRFVPDNEPRY